MAGAQRIYSTRPNRDAVPSVHRSSLQQDHYEVISNRLSALPLSG